MGHPWDEKWTVHEELGEGGQGYTHRVTSKADATKQGALKRLRENGDLQARRRMYSEAANLKLLSAAGGSVPTVLDDNTEYFDDPAVELFLVMEFIPGMTLKQIVKGKRLSVDKAGEIAWNYVAQSR